MLVVAVLFVFFAMTNPEMSLPLPLSATYIIYGIYLALMIILLIAPFRGKYE